MDWTTANERDKEERKRERKTEKPVATSQQTADLIFLPKGRKPPCSLMMVRQCDASQDQLEPIGYEKLRKRRKTKSRKMRVKLVQYIQDRALRDTWIPCI